MSFHEELLYFTVLPYNAVRGSDAMLVFTGDIRRVLFQCGGIQSVRKER